jgi:hypothetical protein
MVSGLGRDYPHQKPEVSATWPGNARFNFFSATCADVPESECRLRCFGRCGHMENFGNIFQNIEKFHIFLISNIQSDWFLKKDV